MLTRTKMTTSLTEPSLTERLCAAIGVAAVSEDVDHRVVMGNDVYRSGAQPGLVVRPTNVAALQAAVRVCADQEVAMVPRGGGASYTDGYLLADGGHVLFDTGALDTIDIDVANATVTVGAGVTWAALRDALAPHGCARRFGGRSRGWSPPSAAA